MKLIFISIIIFILNSCSLNKDSKYWTEDGVKKVKRSKKKLSKYIKKDQLI